MKKWSDITDKEFDEIVAMVKKGARDSEVAAIQWVCKKVLGEYVDYRVVQRLASNITKSGEFSSESNIQNKNDIDIFETRGYKKPKWWIENPLWLAFITFVFSIFASVIAGKVLTPSSQIRVSFPDSINKSIYRISQPVQKIHDTIYIEKPKPIFKNKIQ